VFLLFIRIHSFSHTQFHTRQRVRRPTFADVSVIQTAVSHDEAVGITVTTIRLHAIHARPEGEARIVLSRAAFFFLPATPGIASSQLRACAHLTQTHQRHSEHPPYNARPASTHIPKLLRFTLHFDNFRGRNNSARTTKLSKPTAKSSLSS
jgi:hypothetical protein